MPLFPFSDLIDHGDKVWFNVYSDLLGFEHANLTGYVECFKSDNGLYAWEILGKDQNMPPRNEGFAPTVENAQEIVEHYIGAR